MQLPRAFTFDAPTLTAAFNKVRPRLAIDPLFIDNASAFDVSLAKFDERMQRVPKTSADFYAWLDGADQYRYAGLSVLFEAYGRSAHARTYNAALTIPAERTVLFAGDVTIAGDLTLHAGAIVIVLGTLRIEGPLLADHDYTLVAAHSLEFASGTTSGELIALDSINGGNKVYLAGNDYSCRAPSFASAVLVDFERSNVFGSVHVQQRISEWSFPQAAAALGVSPDDDLQAAFVAILQGQGSALPLTAAPVDQEALWDAARQSPPALAQLLPGSWTDRQLAIALEYAATWEQLDGVKLLLAHGALPHAKAALRAAVNSVAVLDLLLDACGGNIELVDDDQPLLTLACNVGSEAVIKRLLERGFNVNIANRLGVTGLHVCAWHGHVAKAKLLLKQGAAKDLKLINAWHDFAAAGATPLDVANNQLKNQSNAKPWRDLTKLLS